MKKNKEIYKLITEEEAKKQVIVLFYTVEECAPLLQVEIEESIDKIIKRNTWIKRGIISLIVFIIISGIVAVFYKINRSKKTEKNTKNKNIIKNRQII